MNIMNRTKKDIAAAVAEQTGMTKKDKQADMSGLQRDDALLEALNKGKRRNIARSSSRRPPVPDV